MAYIDRLDDVRLVNKTYKKFPVLINNEHVVNRLVLKYFLSHKHIWSETTLETYCKHLCDFFSQVEVEGVNFSFDRVDDSWLEVYAKSILNRDQNTHGYISNILTTIIQFFVWCEDNGYCNNLVGTSSKFQIKIRYKKDKLIHSLIKYYSKQNTQPKIPPKVEWVEKILEVDGFKATDLEVRFNLMVSWGRDSGLRAHEISALTIDQISSNDEIEMSFINKETLYIELTETKGNQIQKIPVSTKLLKRTREYIDFERRDQVKFFTQRANTKGIKYNEPLEIFLSLKTGKALNSRTLSNQIKSRWCEAVRQGYLNKNQHVWTHGLRHLYASNILKKFSGNKKVRNPTTIVKILTRHKNSSTLDIYTAYAFLESFDE